MRMGFVGLGLMGVPMAANMARAGHELVVHSANAASIARLEAEGARVAGSVAEVAGAVDVFCSCRVTPEQSREVFLGAGGVAATAPSGLLCIDFATVDPGTAKEIGAALAARGIGFLDAPISGGPYAAVDAALTAIVGGAEADVARAMPALRATCREVRHMGPVGAGVTAKLCNNLISITTHALLAEAMVLGAKAGIDGQRLYETLRASSARSNTLERVVPKHFLPRNFEAAASIATIMKDLGCAIDLGRALGVDLTLAEAAMRRYEEARDAGHVARDIAAVILPIEEKAGTRVGGPGMAPPAPVAVVTGGARGIGLATCAALLARGWRAVALDRDAPGEDAPAGDGFAWLAADVSDTASVDAAIASAARRFGAIDALVNCAGFNRHQPVAELEDETWRSMLDVHVGGTLRTCRAAHPWLKASARGAVVNFSSMGARIGRPRRAPYAAAKAGIEGLTRTLAIEWAPDSIRVNAVCPGVVGTRMVRDNIARGAVDAASLVSGIPMRRFAEPAEIAAVVAFLAGAELSYMTGQVLVVDGGATINGDW